MKLTVIAPVLFILMASVSVASLTGCVDSDPSKNTQQFKYIQDCSTGICFVWFSHAHRTEGGISLVPCDKVKHVLENKCSSGEWSGQFGKSFGKSFEQKFKEN